MRKVLTLLVLLIAFYSQAQESYPVREFKRQIELRHDNDFFLLTDRYYSSGLFLSYRFRLKNGIFKKHTEQIEIKLIQEIFTPSQTQSTDINEFDRSYAGFSGFATTWSSANKNHLFSAGLTAGIVGPNSGAGGFQRWYHNVLVVSDPPVWKDELKDSFHINLYGSYVREWQLLPNPFGIRFAFVQSGAFGSRDIYLQPEGVLYFGRKSSIIHSIEFNRLNSNEREIYFSFRFSYRTIFYNGLIEGNLFGDNSLVLRKPESSIFNIGFDVHNRNDNDNIKVGIRYTSPETYLAKAHKFFILSYGLAF